MGRGGVRNRKENSHHVPVIGARKSLSIQDTAGFPESADAKPENRSTQYS